jgi:16S rRNA processing protein RimM
MNPKTDPIPGGPRGGRLEGRTEAGADAPLERRVCLGLVAGAHGVRGAVRLKSFAQEPADIARYGPLEDESGAARFIVRLIGAAKGVLIAQLSGVADRDRAEAMRGARLYLPRAALPPPADDEYYHTDLIGLAAVDRDGAAIGAVHAVHDFGAGDTLEIARPEGQPVMVPFTRAAVPVVDVAAGHIVVEPLPGLFDAPVRRRTAKVPA